MSERPAPIRMFRCRPWSCDLPLASCTARWKRSQRERKPGEARSLIHCEKCPIGRAHAAGQLPRKWPDKEKIQRFELVPPPAPSAADLKRAERSRPRLPVLGQPFDDDSDV